ncbi:acyl-CoA thioesterase [Roseomonas sp. JC162]|uniref:Acyl-CoA thioesterase n=1 Tax=Neoroseomonas marina TaxID=1232220 RepID=A0A848E8Q3_9PROT|nr:thioesterase family protein [Neoroseomonas marina]NMJ39688.1 acyl-CoA thioesterase [Neoroseomonas marina]
MSKTRGTRADYRFFLPIPTRWMDNDVYGHVNNVTYYSWFDTVVARFLIDSGFLHIPTAPVIGLVVETQCRYFAPIAFPDEITTALRCGRAGNTSVRYEIAIFRNDEDVAAAEGHFVHVYVDRATQKQPTPLPPVLREALAGITLPAAG